ncbi:aminoglycoside phosphotransferase family protein [Paenibacillus aestuarii]|uniref:Aminoglycoside phosphotransferase family protein n=1 Tax=Paenibacillus aestuarii TaxID=516965 RepID=A0ABW0KCZ6_9BACL|nr:aminoglycoside phosphotransferase family protein [Paenibacillus aestuarii]
MGGNYEFEQKSLIACISRNHPELAKERFQFAEESWSNAVVIVGNRYIFRFPKTDSAKKSLKIEKQVLPKLSERLSLAIPSIKYVSGLNEGLAYAYYPLIKGSKLSKKFYQSLPREQKKGVQKDLGRFLSDLHAYPVKEINNADFTDVDVKENWEHFYKEIKRAISPYSNKALDRSIKQLFDRFLSNPANFKFKPCLLHADLKPSHLLYDVENERLSGVIDFGAMEVGDPAFEFVGLYDAYGKEFIMKVMDHYTGIIDPTFWQRINDFYMKIVHFYDVIYGVETGDAAMIKYHLSVIQKVLQNSS